jgi:hypothetical protein
MIPCVQYDTFVQQGAGSSPSGKCQCHVCLLAASAALYPPISCAPVMHEAPQLPAVLTFM